MLSNVLPSFGAHFQWQSMTTLFAPMWLTCHESRIFTYRSVVKVDHPESRFFCVALVKHTHTHNRFTSLFLGPPRWAGATRELLDFIVQGKINRGRHTEHPARCHSIRTNQCPPPPSTIPHFYRPDALPAAQLTLSKHGRQKLYIQFSLVKMEYKSDLIIVCLALGLFPLHSAKQRTWLLKAEVVMVTGHCCKSRYVSLPRWRFGCRWNMLFGSGGKSQYCVRKVVWALLYTNQKSIGITLGYVPPQLPTV